MKSYKLIYAIVLSCLLVLSGCNTNIGGGDQSNSLNSSANSTTPSGINNQGKSSTSGGSGPSDMIMNQETDAVVDPTTGATVVTSNGLSSLATDPTAGLYVSGSGSALDYFSMSTLIVDNTAFVNTMSGVRSIDVTNLLGINVNPNVSNWSALYINPNPDFQQNPMIAGTTDTTLISPMVLSTVLSPSAVNISNITNNVYAVARDANYNLDILYTTDGGSNSTVPIGQTWSSLFGSTNPNIAYKQQSKYMTAPLAVYNSTSSGTDYIFTAGVSSTSTSDQLLCATNGGSHGIGSCNTSGLPTSEGAKITSLVIDNNNYLFVLYNTGELFAAYIGGYPNLPNGDIAFSKIDNPSTSKLFGLCAPSNAVNNPFKNSLIASNIMVAADQFNPTSGGVYLCGNDTKEFGYKKVVYSVVFNQDKKYTVDKMYLPDAYSKSSVNLTGITTDGSSVYGILETLNSKSQTISTDLITIANPTPYNGKMSPTYTPYFNSITLNYLTFPVLENATSYTSQPYPITNITVSNGLILANVLPYQDSSIGSYTGSYVLATPSLQYLLPWVSIGSNFIVPNTGSGTASTSGNPVVSYFETSVSGHNCGMYISVDPTGNNWAAYATDLSPTSDNVICPFVGNNLYRWTTISGSYIQPIPTSLLENNDSIKDVKWTADGVFYVLTNNGNLLSLNGEDANPHWFDAGMVSSNVQVLQIDAFNDDMRGNLYALSYVNNQYYAVLDFVSGMMRPTNLSVINPVAMSIVNKDNSSNNYNNEVLVVMDDLGGYSFFDNTSPDAINYIPPAYYDGFTLGWPQQLNLQCGVNLIPPASEATNQSAKVNNNVVNGHVNPVTINLNNYKFISGQFTSRIIDGKTYSFMELIVQEQTTGEQTSLQLPLVLQQQDPTQSLFLYAINTQNDIVFVNLTPLITDNNTFTLQAWNADPSEILPNAGTSMADFPNLTFNEAGNPYITIITPSDAYPPKTIDYKIKDFNYDLGRMWTSILFGYRWQAEWLLGHEVQINALLKIVRDNIAGTLGYGLPPGYDPGPSPTPLPSPPPPASGGGSLLLPLNYCAILPLAGRSP